MATLTSPSRTVRRLRGLSLRRPAARAALLYAALALGMLWPFRNRTQFRQVGDLYAVLGGITEARLALKEHQFPVRVAPSQLAGARYPIFQFYGNFPYTAAGLINLILPVTPYTAWKIAVFLSLTGGGLYTFRTARQFTHNVPAALAAGTVFMTAPYMFTDLMGRGAYAEFVAFNLLPAALFYAWRCFVSPRPVFLFRSALAWALLGLSHNITYLYGVLFIGGLFLLMWSCRRRFLLRLGRAAAAGVLHLALVLWYIVPQFRVLKLLIITPGILFQSLTSLGNLLRPIAFTPPESTTGHLTPQVGWPILAGVLIALVRACLPGCTPRARTLILRLLAMFALAFVMVWSPVDFWWRAPKLLQFVQFPYRLLMFVVLFGCLLAACGLAGIPKPRWRRACIGLFALLAVATAFTYLPADEKLDPLIVAQQVRYPEMGGLEDYLLNTRAASETSWRPRGLNLAGPEFGLTDRHWLRGPTGVTVPGLPNARTLEIEGELLPESAKEIKLTLDVSGTGRLQRRVPASRFHFSFPLRQSPGPAVDLAVAAEGPGGENVEIYVSGLEFRSNAADEGELPFLPFGSVKRQTHFARRTRLKVALPARTLVELPVIFYPRLLSLTDNGKTVPYGNIGRYVALPLDGGSHQLEVRFRAVPWADVTSFAAWIVLVLGLLVPLRRRRA